MEEKSGWGDYDFYWDGILKEIGETLEQLRVTAGIWHLFSTKRHHSKHSSRAGPDSRQPMLLALQATANWCRDRIWRPMTGIRGMPLRIFLKLKNGKNHRCHFFSSTQEVLLVSRGFVIARRCNSPQPNPAYTDLTSGILILKTSAESHLQWPWNIFRKLRMTNTIWQDQKGEDTTVKKLQLTKYCEEYYLVGFHIS